MSPRKSLAHPKRPYQAPRLVVHGDLRALTLVKKGSMADGARKPTTRASGSNS